MALRTRTGANAGPTTAAELVGGALFSPKFTSEYRQPLGAARAVLPGVHMLSITFAQPSIDASCLARHMNAKCRTDYRRFAWFHPVMARLTHTIMLTPTLSFPENYDPDLLLDTLLKRLNLKDDAALSRALHIARPLLSSIRQRTIGVGAGLLVRMAEVSDLSITDLRRLMGDQRVRLRVAGGRIRRIERR